MQYQKQRKVGGEMRKQQSSESEETLIPTPKKRVTIPKTKLVCENESKLFNISVKTGKDEWRKGGFDWKKAFMHIFRKKALVGTVAAITVLTVTASVCMTNFAFAYTVMVDGKAVGVVGAKEAALATYEDVNQELSKIDDVQGDVVSKPEFVFTIVPASAQTTEEELKQNILSTVDAVTTAYAILVDGQPVVGLPTQDLCGQALALMKTNYGIEVDAKVEILENMTIAEAAVPVPLYVATPAEAQPFLTAGKEEAKDYTVQAGDVFSVIAENHQMTVEELAALNPDVNPELIKQDQVLHIKTSEPILQLQEIREEKVEREVPFQQQTIEDNTMLKGQKTVVTEGINGKSIATLNVTYINGERKGDEIVSEESISEPVPQVVKIGTKEAPKTEATGSFAMPVSGTLSSSFGSRWGRSHTGIDLAATTGTPVKAADGGTVTYAGWMSGYGNLVIIDHNNGYKTYYAHMSAITTSVGRKVAKGQQVGKVGSTGNSTGPHLHFEVRKNNTPQNPLNYIG